MSDIRKPIDYTDRFIIIEKICAPGKGETFRFFYHSKGNLCTALAVGDGRVKKPGDKVYFKDIKENGLASSAQIERFNRAESSDKESGDSIDWSLFG